MLDPLMQEDTISAGRSRKPSNYDSNQLGLFTMQAITRPKSSLQTE